MTVKNYDQLEELLLIVDTMQSIREALRLTKEMHSCNSRYTRFAEPFPGARHLVDELTQADRQITTILAEWKADKLSEG